MSDAGIRKPLPAISIEWLSDSYDCDDCGPSWAEGALIRIEGMEDIDMSPGAHCYGGTHYTREEVFRKILEVLGHSITETERTSDDDSYSVWDD